MEKFYVVLIAHCSLVLFFLQLVQCSLFFFASHSVQRIIISVSCLLITLITFRFTKKWFLQDEIDVRTKAVLITGCDSGFGYQLAQRLDRKGFKVFASCLFPNGTGANELKTILSKSSKVFGLDVTKQESIQNAFNLVKENLGTYELWAVVNNAGIRKGFSMEMSSIQDFEDCMDVNALGHVRIAKAFLNLLRTSKGRIINVNSISSRIPIADIIPYCMSKHAVAGFNDCLRAELANTGIKVISVEATLFLFFYEMEISSNISLDHIPWQATVDSFFSNLRDAKLAFIQAPKILNQRIQKELTKEATCMIYVMLTFVLLAVLGSSITVYESFFKDNGRKTHSQRNDFKQNCGKRIKIMENGLKYLKPHDNTLLENCKYLLKCFCMVNNGRKILSTDSSESQIDCIQGLRFICNTWLILSHTSLCYFSSLKDIQLAKPALELWTSQIALNGIFAVDIFFVISGMLNVYNFYHKYNGNISWFFFYFKRFIRLTPVYTIVLGFYSTLFAYMGTGVLWPSYNTNPACKENWWWYLLYINNFIESPKECFAWCWYLATEMQFYIISPIFMIALRRWTRLGYALIFACICSSCAASFMLTIQYNLTDGLSRFVFHLEDPKYFLTKFWEYFDILYKKPYTRIGQYLIGLILGHYLYKKSTHKKVIRNNKMILCCGWVATAIFMWICFFSLHLRKEVVLETALYNGTKFLLSSCSFAWIIYVCFTGQAEFFNACLSWKALYPLGRLSYCAYLIHPIILKKLFLQNADLMDFNIMLLMSLSLYTCAYTYIISFIVSTFFEMPVLNILNWLSMKNGRNISSRKCPDCKADAQKFSDSYKLS